MIGPLIATALIGLVVKPIDIPTRTRPIGQVMISAHVGLAFNAAALTAILDHGVTILCVAVATAMIGVLMSGVLRGVTGVDQATAFLARLQAGQVRMANVAPEERRDPGRVVLARTTT